MFRYQSIDIHHFVSTASSTLGTPLFLQDAFSLEVGHKGGDQIFIDDLSSDKILDSIGMEKQISQIWVSVQYVFTLHRSPAQVGLH